MKSSLLSSAMILSVKDVSTIDSILSIGPIIYLVKMNTLDIDENQPTPRASMSCSLLQDMPFFSKPTMDFSSSDDYDYDSTLSIMMELGRESCWTDSAFESTELYSSSSSAFMSDESSFHDSLGLSLSLQDNPCIDSDITDSQTASASGLTPNAVCISPRSYEPLSEVLSSKSLRQLNDSNSKYKSSPYLDSHLDTIYETAEEGNNKRTLSNHRRRNFFKCLWSMFRIKRSKVISHSESNTSASASYKEKSQVILHSLSDDDCSIQTSLIVFDPRT